MLRDAWRLSLGTLTAVPVRSPILVDRRRAGVAMVLAPVAAMPLGIALVLVLVVAHDLGLPPLVSSLLGIGAAVVGNRAFHLDGLADTVDGMAASYDRDRSLAVMKSGTSGPAGVAAIVLVVGLQVSALSSMVSASQPLRAGVLAGVAFCVSRAALTVCCLRGVPSARPGGLGDTYTQSVPRAAAALVWVLGTAVVSVAASWAGLAWWRGAVGALLALAVASLVVDRAVRRFGGVTGDVFGASIELALATLLVALA
ncbi:adenosylcobinamide-GDP ribazoletransferase [Nocardioides terrisoli]|uniref:adenosylcobinamide-GDP ribazoletransferase n=1 Tax=Nocardioides terrisoli TaxID=3388267 RepID=UPI00287B84EA|nr:adenosylcobinamide-GDP ribazoletransferase [Nocardioides marmorisolisilvae]